jgi:hypothetical protein
VNLSEIPKIEVITAVADAEREDFLAQLLFSQGWNIIFRALDDEALINFLEERGRDRRTVVVHQGFFNSSNKSLIDRLTSQATTFISIEEVPFTSHELMVRIRGALRAPLIQGERQGQNSDFAEEELSSHSISDVSARRFPSRGSAPAIESEFAESEESVRSFEGSRRSFRTFKELRTRRKVIAVTGSSGAPGRTQFAKAMAKELQKVGPVILVDADIRSQGSHFKTGDIDRLEVIPMNREKRPTQIPEGVESAVVDLGILHGVGEAIHDRRWHGSLVNNVLDQASHLVYVAKSTPASMIELTQFIREYPLLQKRLPVFYICILTGHSRELREWESKFLSLTMGENRFIVRESELGTSQGSFLGSLFKSNQSGGRAIAKIAGALV